MKPRVIRKEKPKRKFTKNTYRKALPHLLIDFKNRCAYSMRHKNRIGQKCMEVDHFNPKLKNIHRNAYSNLFPSIRACNLAKSDTWPTIRQKRKGLRFLNPCKETDYGEHIFEDPTTHELIGVTPTGKFHIRLCDLNEESLITERCSRSKLRKKITQVEIIQIKKNKSFQDLLALLKELRKELGIMIPEIPYLENTSKAPSIEHL